MPIVDGVYQAPTWVNNGPPAMDEVEMQAICDTVAQTGNVTTPAQTLGLTGDLSVGASLGVLATVGDLHVWRRTVINQEEVPASYTLENITNQTINLIPFGGVSITYAYGSSVTVSDNGKVVLSQSGTAVVSPSSNGLNSIKGQYIQAISSSNGSYGAFASVSVYFIPSNANYYTNPSGLWCVSEAQKVVGTPKIPEGTYTDYPVSVNPNAYKTGSDEQPAGYTLGEVQSGNKVIANSSTGNIVYYADSVSVADDGIVSLSNQSQFPWDYKQPTSGTDVLLGKFVRGNSPQAAEIVFIPGNASFSSQFSPTGTGYDFYVSQYQTVTGYPAIPAGTTIEYLGKLGDKSRMQIVSYVGTGTYGSGNKTVVSFDFTPSIIFIFGSAESDNVDFGIFVNGFSVSSAFLPNTNANSVYPRTNNFTLDSGELSLYNIGDARSQLNTNGKKYTAIGLA